MLRGGDSGRRWEGGKDRTGCNWVFQVRLGVSGELPGSIGRRGVLRRRRPNTSLAHPRSARLPSSLHNNGALSAAPSHPLNTRSALASGSHQSDPEPDSCPSEDIFFEKSVHDTIRQTTTQVSQLPTTQHPHTTHTTRSVAEDNLRELRCHLALRAGLLLVSPVTPSPMPRSRAAAAAAAKAATSDAVDKAVAAGETTPAPPAFTASSPSSARRSVAGSLRSLLDSLPEPARLGLLVVLSLSLNTLGRSVLDRRTNNELGAITRSPEGNPELYLTLAWKVLSIALGWVSGYDGYDIAALAFLSTGPVSYLTSVFYGVRAITAGAYLAVDVVSASLPFFLLRKPSGAHSAAPNVTNREIVVDRGIQVLTSLLAGDVYNVVLFLASRTYLPNALVLYFEGIPTIRPAAEATLLSFENPTAQIFCLLLGIAARAFIFTPVVTTPRTAKEEQELADFDPVAATLGETVAFNLWGFTNQTKVSVKRTAVMMLFTAVNTYLQCTLGIKQVESYGAMVYTSIWVISALVTGLSLRYVGSV